MNCQAIIFDLDGVLIDAEFIYLRHWRKWAAHNEVSFDHILDVHHGSPARRTMEIVAPHLDVHLESSRFNSQLEADMNMEGTIAYPGVEKAVQHLPPDRWAIATSAPRKIALARLQFLELPIPTVLVAPEDVERGKPAPDPYLKAAKDLGFAPTDCLVIEDAPAGIEGALKAGAQVLALATTHKPDALVEAHAICPQFWNLMFTADDTGIVVSWDDST